MFLQKVLGSQIQLHADLKSQVWTDVLRNVVKEYANPRNEYLLLVYSSDTPPASSFMQLGGENQCLKAAQDCGLYEKCGNLRSEYVLACTKPMPSTNRCNQHKCHRSLRRFLERVPEEYSLGVLFCRCTDTLCGERRRKTIVPSCSYHDKEGLQLNCLHQQSFCRRDDLCRLDIKCRGRWTVLWAIPTFFIFCFQWARIFCNF